MSDEQQVVAPPGFTVDVPQGFKLDEPPSAGVTPPAGFTIDVPKGFKLDEPEEKLPEGGFLEALGAGAMRGTRGVGETAAALSGETPKPEKPTRAYEQPTSWSDFLHPVDLSKKLAYGMAESYPMLAGGILGGGIGGAAGTALAGPPGGVVGALGGGAAGAAVGTALQSFGQNFAAAMDETQGNRDKAFDLAWKRTGIEGAVSAASWAAFGGINPFKTHLRNLAFQALAVQPGVTAAGKAAENVSEGKPAGEGVAETVPGAIIGTAAPMLGHKLATAAAGRMRGRAAPETGAADSAESAGQPSTSAGEPAESAAPPPGAPPPAGEVVGLKMPNAPSRRATVDQYFDDGKAVRLRYDDGEVQDLLTAELLRDRTQPPPARQEGPEPTVTGEGPTEAESFNMMAEAERMGPRTERPARPAPLGEEAIDALRRADILEKAALRGGDAYTAEQKTDMLTQAAALRRRYGAPEAGPVSAEDAEKAARARAATEVLGEKVPPAPRAGQEFTDEELARSRAARQPAPAPEPPPSEILGQPAPPISREAPEFTDEELARAQAARARPPEAGTRAMPVKVETADDVAAAARHVNTEPTEAQAKAGNYKKGHLRFQGLDITLENPAGSTRRGTGPDGPWETTLEHPYGYIKRTEGADGDHVDVYLGPNPDSDRVTVIDQKDPATGQFDEHKAILGANSVGEALEIYTKGFSDGSGMTRVGGINQMSVDEFKAWLKGGDTTAPAHTRELPPPAVAAPEAVQPPAASPVAPPERPAPTRAEPAPGRSPTLDVTGLQPIGTAPESPYQELHFGSKLLGAPTTAITSTGRVVPVQYALVEARDLVTSHTDDLRENPAYPQAIQPRDRTRGTTELQIRDMLNPQRFRPELLGPSPDAANGAPIVGPDAVVESGNARTMALRRAYAEGQEAAEMYRRFLESQGYPVDGMREPVLVRINRASLTPEEREAFARDANKPAQLAMSATERAMADANALPDHLLDLAQPGELVSAANRPFIMAVLRSIASQNEIGSMVGKDGALSQEGVRRVQGAVLAKAYGDASLVETLLESTDGNYKAIGAALLEAAPVWAKMRNLAKDGAIPPELDVTPRLMEAVGLIARARNEGRNVVEYVKQADMFAGSAVEPQTEAVLRWMLGGVDFTRRLGQAKIAESARFYATEAMKMQPGAGLFGETPAARVPELVEAARVRAQGTTGERAEPGLLGQAVGSPAGTGAVRPGAGPHGPEIQGSEPHPPGVGGAEGGAGREGEKPAEVAPAETPAEGQPTYGKLLMQRAAAAKAWRDAEKQARMDSALMREPTVDVAAAKAGLDAVNAEVARLEIQGGTERPTTAESFRAKFGIPDDWKVPETYAHGETRPRDAYADYGGPSGRPTTRLHVQMKDGKPVATLFAWDYGQSADGGFWRTWLKDTTVEKALAKVAADREAARAPQDAAVHEGEPPERPGAAEEKPADGETGMMIVPTKHTKTGAPLWAVQLGERVGTDRFKELGQQARKLGGYYSSFRGKGAVPGFLFKSEEAARQFMGGEAPRAPEGAEAAAPPPTEAPPAAETKPAAEPERFKEAYSGQIVNATEEAARKAGIAKSPTTAVGKQRKQGFSFGFADGAVGQDRARMFGDQPEPAREAYRKGLAAGKAWGEAERQQREQAATPAAAPEAAPPTETKPSTFAVHWDDELTPHGRRELVRKATQFKEPEVERISKTAARYLDPRIEEVLDRARLAEAAAAEKPAETPQAAAPEAGREIIHAADGLATLLQHGEKLDAKKLQAVLEATYGAKLSEGKFTRADMYEALELAVNKVIRANPERFDPRVDPAAAERFARELQAMKDRLPTQTVRAGEKETHQQFSTPPDYSYAVAWVAKLRPEDRVIEPSAGTGSIAVHAMNAGVREVVVNEISERRAALVESLGPSRVFRENAEHLNDILPADVKPSVVLMNPPFSQTAGRMGTKKVIETGAVHIEQALKRLDDGGRLVAIVGRGMSQEAARFKDWWSRIAAQYNVRANVGVDGGVYTKYGTGFATRLLVIDKVPPDGRPPVTGDVKTVPELIGRLAEVRDDRVEPREAAGEQLAGEPPREGVARQGEGAREPGPPVPAAAGPAGPGEGRPAPGAGSEVPGGSRPGVGGNARPEARPGEGDALVHEQSGRGEPAGAEPRPGAEPRAGEDVGERGTGGDGNVLRPDRGGERALPERGEQPAGVEEPAIKVDEAAADPEKGGAITEAVYEPYRPQRVAVSGAKSHPGELVQSSAMASVLPPKPGYAPKIPDALVKAGELSDAQLESIVYAGQAHSQVLPAAEDEPARRRGFFIGDGTGVGKGREVAGIILDNWRQGRQKALWLTEKKPLINDAKRDWKGLKQDPAHIFDLGKTKPGGAIKADRGILFTTYDTLKGTERLGKDAEGKTIKGKSRIDQIADWVGPDFDGVIAFDEAHNMANAVEMKGSRGVKEAAQKAIAGLELQDRLPNARVVYVSATGATEVSNLAYADRLGLWGRGTAFPTRAKFISEVQSGGIAAMELVARDMKAMGSYIARSLSYNGVEYNRLEHKLSPDQRVIYDKLAESWQVALNNFEKALELTGAKKDSETGQGGNNSQAISKAMSAFWGAHQRFFNQIVTAMQMPTVLRSVERDLKEGRQAVLQLVNTNEASQKRALAKIEDAAELEDLDMTPRDQLMQLVEHSFPVAMHEEYVDENGVTRSRPVEDAAGNVVESREAVEMRERLLNELGSIRVPDGPMEMLINHFGPDKVAEVTGRKQRVVRKPDDKGQVRSVVETRPGSANVVEADAFQAGKKPVLVFSEAGGTGRSYHADRKSESADKRRAHYLVQAGWRADKAIQGFGRTHRTNQASAPIFHLVTTDLEGQKRFISSIARRLAQLGALTKGERRTGDSGLFSARDNLESREAGEALYSFFRDLHRGAVEGLNLQDFERETGLKLSDSDSGGLRKDLPEIPQFLNRLLSLKIDMQNRVFGEFERRLDDANDRAAAAGTLDTGVETVKADRIAKVDDKVVYRDPDSGAETRHVHLNVSNKTYPTSFDDIMAGKGRTQDNRPGFFVVSERSGRVSGVVPARDITDKNGSIIPQYRLVGPLDFQFIDRHKIDGYGADKNWKKVTDPATARKLWDERVAKIPEYVTDDLHLITGAVLPIWDRLSGTPKVFRLQTDAGERMLGRVVPNGSVKDTLKALGAEHQQKIEPARAVEDILGGGYAKLANGWTIRRALVAGEPRLELVGPNYTHANELAGDGVFSERIQYATRYFIPTGDDAAKVLAKVTERRPITDLTRGRDDEGAVAVQRARPEETPALKRDDGERPRGETVRIARGLEGEIRPSDSFTEHENELADAVYMAAKATFPGAGVRAYGKLRANGEIGEPGEVHGATVSRAGLPHVIAWSLEATDPMGTIRHEGIHYLRRSGLLDDKEWSTLAKAADEKGWIKEHEIDRFYSHLPHDLQQEEAVAEQFRKWRRDKGDIGPRLPEAVRGIFYKLDLLARRIAAAARRVLGKDATADDIFTRIETGEVGRRIDGEEEGAPELSPAEQRGGLFNQGDDSHQVEGAAAEKLYDEAQAIMRGLPRNIGKAMQEGRLSQKQQASLARLNEIERVLPPTSKEWKRVADQRHAAAMGEYQKTVASFGAEQLERLKETGLAVGDKVEMTARSFLPTAPGRKYVGEVRQGSRGDLYVSAGGQRFDVFSNPWRKVEGAERPTVDLTDQGEQRVLPGAEQVTKAEVAASKRPDEKALAEQALKGPKRATRPQESAGDLPLFGGERQKDLLDLAQPAAPKAAEPEKPAPKKGEQLTMFQRAHPEDSPEFKRWFGESKVVDEEGKPLVVYHGTAADFDTFDTGRSIGSWFTENSRYAGLAADAAGNVEGGGAKIIPVYLSIQKPATLDQYREAWQATHSGSDAQRLLMSRGYDGVIGNEGQDRTFIAFRPGQIKSAVGNRGAYDPNDARIAFQRAHPEAGTVPPEGRDPVDHVAEEMASEVQGTPPGTYARTLLRRLPGAGDLPTKMLGMIEPGTIQPRTLAAMDARSARFWETWRQKDDTRNSLATRWAEMSRSYVDLKHAERRQLHAVEELDRLDGRVRRDDGRSIVARNDAHDQAEFSKPGQSVVLKGDVARAYRDRRALFADVWREMTRASAERLGWHGAVDPAAIRQAADAAVSGGEKKRLRNVADLVEAMQEQERQGYVPLMRHGDYFIAVKPKDGNPAWNGEGFPPVHRFELVDSRGMLDRIFGKTVGSREVPKNAAERIADLRRQFPESDWDIESGYLHRKQDMLRSLDIPAVEKLLMLMEQRDPKLFEGMVEEIRSRMYEELKAGFKRKATQVPGYSPDFERATGAYLAWTARNAADLRHREAIEEAQHAYLDTHPDPAVKTYWRKWQEYQESPANEMAQLRQIGFLYALAGNVSSSLLNLSDIPIQMHSHLAVAHGVAEAGKAAYGAAGEALRAVRADRREGIHVDLGRLGRDPGEKALIRALEADGSLHSQATREVRGLAAGEENALRPYRRDWHKAIDLVSSTFGVTDQANRAAMALAAYRLAKKPGALDAIGRAWGKNQVFREMVAQRGLSPETYARFMTEEALGLWGKENRPAYARGTVPSMLLQFKRYDLFSLGQAYKMLTRMGGEGRLASLLMLGGVLALGGVRSLPFGQDLMQGYDALIKAITGDDPMAKASLYRLLEDQGLSAEGAEAVMAGLPRALGIDLSGRVGQGEMVERNSQPLQVIGTTPSMLVSAMMRASERWQRGQPLGALAEVLPAALRNPFRAGVVYPNEGVKTTYGTTVLRPQDIGPGEQAARAAGFQPTRVAREYERREYVRDLANQDKLAKSRQAAALTDIAVRQAEAVRSGDQAAVARLQQEMDALVRAHPELKVSVASLQSRVRQAMEPEAAMVKRLSRDKRPEGMANPFPGS